MKKVFFLIAIIFLIGLGTAFAETLILPDSLTVIGAKAFMGDTSLDEVVLPEGIREIKADAFAGSSLSSINLPASLKSIADGALPAPGFVTVTAEEGTWAYDWAMEKGYIGGTVTEYTPVSSFEYEIVSAECTITKYHGDDTVVVIPRQIEGTPVTAIGFYAFGDCLYLENVILGDGIRCIGVQAFCNCVNLKIVSLGDDIKSIEDQAFCNCENLQSLFLGENTVEIGDEVFSGCTNLKSIYIPASVETIGYNCFDNCITLESIDVDPNNDYYRSDNGVLIGKYEYASSDSLFGNGSFWDVVLKYPSGKKANVCFCNAEDGVAPFAFRDCQYLREIHFTKESDWTIVAKDAFVNCNALKRVEFAPDDFIMEVGDSAFNNCPSLEIVSFADANLSYSYNFDPFKNCGNPTVIVDPGQENWCIRHGIAYIYAEENPDSDLAADIMQTQPSYGQIVAVGSEIKVSANVSGGKWPLEYNFAISVDGKAPVASGWISQNTYAFETSAKGSYNCFVVVRDSERNRCLSDALFGTIGEPGQTASGTLRYGDDWAIKWQITYDEDGQGNKTNAQLYIYLEGSNASEGSLLLYSQLGNGFLMPWLTDEYGFTKEMFTKISITGGNANPFEIVSDTFSGYVNVGRVELSRVKTLQARAFEDNDNLMFVKYDSWLTTIGDGAFKNCSKMSTFIISMPINYIETIGNEAFMNTGLTNISSLYSAKNIGSRAFANAKLKSIYLGPDVMVIGNGAFDGCDEIVICCYLDSNAYIYAVNNDIRYALQDSRIDLLLRNSSVNYDTDLSIMAAELSLAAYTGDGDSDVREYLKKEGFKNSEILSNNYNGGSLAFTVATKDAYIGSGVDDLDILVVVARGTVNDYERLNDVLSLPTSSYRDYAIYGIVNDFRNAIYEYLDMVVDEEKTYKILLTGHSLAGAAINRLGAELTDKYGNNNVYCYTYGALNSISDFDCNYYGRTVSAGYENIHNVYNDYDTWSPSQYGNFLITEMGAKYGKFGHIDDFSIEYRDARQQKLQPVDQIIDSINHAMHNYVKAVKAGSIRPH